MSGMPAIVRVLYRLFPLLPGPLLGPGPAAARDGLDRCVDVDLAPLEGFGRGLDLRHPQDGQPNALRIIAPHGHIPVARSGHAPETFPSRSARKFRQTTGVSLARFVNRRRLQAAIRQFATTNVLLATLAQELGFSWQSHFTRLFSRLSGMPPGR